MRCCGGGGEPVTVAVGTPVAVAVGVGDGGNDLSLVREAGLGIAMGNATDELKSASDVVVRDNDHDGCAEAVLRFMA